MELSPPWPLNEVAKGFARDPSCSKFSPGFCANTKSVASQGSCSSSNSKKAAAARLRRNASAE
eukprot:CAMPEP_0114646066 /NCGR_PEP_ID=MMETSP0191-20121206/4945_1 /TAXON_ID=126664 /ORGANISM="Sorites sp." /LENGTH=62 /DNA_ID=CAMNT_0001858855 /DNA_START=315 /DNA_END=500 /DNA_ORIENTATION=+